jgi:hypothetical protein
MRLHQDFRVPRFARFSLNDARRAWHALPIQVLGEVATGTAHKTWRSIAIDWIAAGCPLPAVPAVAPDGPTATLPKSAPQDTRHRPPVPAGAPVTSVTAALREDARTEPRIPLLGLFQQETWEKGFDDVPVHGNGALH